MPKKRTLYLSIAELKELGLIKKYLRKKRRNKKKQKLAAGNTIQPYQGYNGIKSVSEMQSSYNQINRNNDIDNAIKYKLLENAEKQGKVVEKSKEQTEEEFKTQDKLKSDLESFNKFIPYFEDYTKQTDRNFMKTGELIQHMNSQIIKPYTLERNQDGNFFEMPSGDLYNSESGIKLGGVNLFDSQDTPQSSNSELFLPEGETQGGQLSVSGQGINNAINTEGTPQTPVSQTPVPQTPPNTVPLQQPNKNVITAEDQALFTSLRIQALDLAQGDETQIGLIEKLKNGTPYNIKLLQNKIKNLPAVMNTRNNNT